MVAAAAVTAVMVEATVRMTMAEVTAKVAGSDNNQLKAAAEEMTAVATANGGCDGNNNDNNKLKAKAALAVMATAMATATAIGGPAGEFPANIFYPSRIPKKNPSANNHKKPQKTSGQRTDGGDAGDR